MKKKSSNQSIPLLEKALNGDPLPAKYDWINDKIKKEVELLEREDLTSAEWVLIDRWKRERRCELILGEMFLESDPAEVNDGGEWVYQHHLDQFNAIQSRTLVALSDAERKARPKDEHEVPRADEHPVQLEANLREVMERFLKEPEKPEHIIQAIRSLVDLSDYKRLVDQEPESATVRRHEQERLETEAAGQRTHIWELVSGSLSIRMYYWGYDRLED